MKSAEEDIEHVVNSPSSSSLVGLAQLNSSECPLETCSSDLKFTEQKLEACLAKSSRWKKLGKALVWLFKTKEVVDIINRTERQKTGLQLGLSVNNTALTIRTNNKIEETKDAINLAKFDRNRKDIIRWLSNTDPSSNHVAAREKHQSTTGEWLLGDKWFEIWKTAPNSIFGYTGK
ncbi:MAG: hypothetical protein MMC33_008443, partial [Icmadophila ericetorum]|nr:hypothetical protein [Icmadophila ericetorum]